MERKSKTAEKRLNFFIHNFNLQREICDPLIKLMKFYKETDDLEKRGEEKAL